MQRWLRCGAAPTRQLAGLSSGLLARRAPRAALRPSGPRRRRRAPGPGSRPRRLSAVTSQRGRASCKTLPSSRRSSLEPRKITVKSAPAARPPDGASATPDCDLPRLVWRLSGGWGTAEMHGAQYVAVNLWLAMCGSHPDARLLLVLVDVTHSTVYGR
jgi:hypothetical protein